MANNCWYDLSVKGTEADVKEFIRAMKWEGEYAEQGVGRVFDFYISDEFEWSGLYYCKADGDCAWSVKSAMCNISNPNNLEELSKRLNLTIEIFSSEPGIGFKEHFVVENGTVMCDDCFDYYECDIDEFEEMMQNGDIGDDFWEQDYVVEAGMTKENYMEFEHDGYIEVGGCELNWEFV